MQIRKALISDIPELTKLFNAYRMFYNKQSDMIAAEKFLTARMKNEESVIYVAESSMKDLLGFVQLYPIFSSTEMKRLWLLNDLYVDRLQRGRGISVQLIDRAKELCRVTDACGLCLETEKTNAIGNSLYPKTGFILDEEYNY